MVVFFKVKPQSHMSYDRSPTNYRPVVVRGRLPVVERFFAVGKRLSVIGDWLFEHLGRLEVYDAASKTFCRPNWSGEGFSGLKSVAERSPTGLQWLPALAEQFFDRQPIGEQ